MRVGQGDRGDREIEQFKSGPLPEKGVVVWHAAIRLRFTSPHSYNPASPPDEAAKFSKFGPKYLLGINCKIELRKETVCSLCGTTGMPARDMRGQAREGRGTIRPQKRVNKTRTAAMVLQAKSLPAGAYSSGRKG